MTGDSRERHAKTIPPIEACEVEHEARDVVPVLEREIRRLDGDVTRLVWSVVVGAQRKAGHSSHVERLGAGEVEAPNLHGHPSGNSTLSGHSANIGAMTSSVYPARPHPTRVTKNERSGRVRANALKRST